MFVNDTQSMRSNGVFLYDSRTNATLRETIKKASSGSLDPSITVCRESLQFLSFGTKCSKYGEHKKGTQFWLENLEERDYLGIQGYMEEQYVNGFLEQYNVRMHV